MKVTEETKDMIREGKSLNFISRETGLSKSTLYYHYKQIKGRKIKLVNTNFRTKNQLGEFLGIFSGDGSFSLNKNYHYTIRISIGYYEKEYAYYLESFFERIFNKKPRLYYLKYKGNFSVIILVYDSKVIYNLITDYLYWESKKTYSIKLRNLNLKEKEFNKGFLKGLIDTDGNYYGPKRRLSFSTTSYELAKQAEEIFIHNLSVKPNFNHYKKEKRAVLYTLTIHGKNAITIIKRIKLANLHKNLQ